VKAALVILIVGAFFLAGDSAFLLLNCNGTLAHWVGGIDIAGALWLAFMAGVIAGDAP